MDDEKKFNNIASYSANNLIELREIEYNDEDEDEDDDEEEQKSSKDLIYEVGDFFIEKHGNKTPQILYIALERTFKVISIDEPNAVAQSSC